MASAQALFLQGAQLTVMVLTLRKEPGIFWCCSQEQLSAQRLNKWSRIQQKETNILSPPPWTSHLSYTGEHWWLRSHKKEPSCSAPDSGKSWMWMGARGSMASALQRDLHSPHSKNRLLGAEQLWRSGGLGQDSEENAFWGWWVFTRAVPEGAGDG